MLSRELKQGLFHNSAVVCRNLQREMSRKNEINGPWLHLRFLSPGIETRMSTHSRKFMLKMLRFNCKTAKYSFRTNFCRDIESIIRDTYYLQISNRSLKKHFKQIYLAIIQVSCDLLLVYTQLFIALSKQPYFLLFLLYLLFFHQLSLRTRVYEVGSFFIYQKLNETEKLFLSYFQSMKYFEECLCSSIIECISSVRSAYRPAIEERNRQLECSSDLGSTISW